MNYGNNSFRLSVLLASALALSACGGGGGGAPAQSAAPATVTRQATLTTGQETPAPTLPDTAATTPGGTASFTLYSTNKLRGSLTLTGFNLSGTPQTTAVTAAHIHDGVVGSNGNPVVTLSPDTAKVVWSVPAGTTLTDAQITAFKDGGYYVNAHTATNGAGLFRGQLISFTDNIQTIFTANCVACHTAGGTAPMSLAAGAAISNIVNVTSTFSAPNGPRVNPGDSSNSVLFKRVSGNTVGPQMPLNGTGLSAANQNLIKVWIDMGAANN